MFKIFSGKKLFVFNFFNVRELFYWFYSHCQRLFLSLFLWLYCYGGWKTLGKQFCAFLSLRKTRGTLITVRWCIRRKGMIHKNMIHKAGGWPDEKQSRNIVVKEKINEIFLNIFSLYFPLFFTFTLTLVWNFHAYFSTEALVTLCLIKWNVLRHLLFASLWIHICPRKFSHFNDEEDVRLWSLHVASRVFDHIEFAVIMKIKMKIDNIFKSRCNKKFLWSS